MQHLRALAGLLTLGAVAGGGFYLWSLLDGGMAPDEFRFTLLFEQAESLAPGAALRHRGVRVGEVRGLALAPGGGRAEVLCTVEHGARPTVTATTRFWIVRPRFEGLATGASGLDTLIKESYVAYENPPVPGPSLSPGARVPGLESPPGGREAVILPGEPGHLTVTVLFPESGELRTGSPVRLRGLPVGVVRAVELTAAGGAVRVEAEIQRAVRAQVQTHTRFWIARPQVSAQWHSGLAIEELQSLVSGPSLEFHTDPARRSAPAPDGAHFVGLLERPDIAWDPTDREISTPSTSVDPIARGPEEVEGLVRLHLSFVERGWVRRTSRSVQGLGALFRTADGSALVVAHRSVIDPAQAPTARAPRKIDDEELRVELPRGGVLDAGRIWADPEGHGVALVKAMSATGALQVARLDYWAAQELAGQPVEAYWRGVDGNVQHTATTVQDDLALAGLLPQARSGLLVRDGAVVGVFGPAPAGGSGSPPRAVPLGLLPPPLRPPEPLRPSPLAPSREASEPEPAPAPRAGALPSVPPGAPPAASPRTDR